MIHVRIVGAYIRSILFYVLALIVLCRVKRGPGKKAGVTVARFSIIVLGCAEVDTHTHPNSHTHTHSAALDRTSFVLREVFTVLSSIG